MKKQFLHKLSWKQKNKLLLAGSIVLLWFVYSFAISNTIELKSSCDEQQKQMDSIQDAPEKLVQLEAELARFSALTGNGNDTLHDVHEQLLNFVTVYCDKHDLVLREFIQPVRYKNDEWTVETHPITVEGNYIEIVRFIRALELESTGRIVSVDFFTKTDNKTKVRSLLATIYVQNISNVTS